METKRLANLVAVLLSILTIGFVKTQQEDGQVFAIARGKTYYFSDTVKLNWYKAADYCRTRGMFLVSINNAEELDGVKKFIEDNGYTKTQDVLHLWTSGNDLGEEGQYVWSATGKRLTFDNWRKDEPNNYKHDRCTFENCIVLEYFLPWSIKYRFDDRPCNVPHFFMCESLGD